MLGVVTGFLQTPIGGCPLWRILVFFFVFLLALLIGRIVRFSLERTSVRLNGSHRELWGKFLGSLGSPALFIIVIAGMWFGFAVLGLQGRPREVADTITRVLYTVATGFALYRLVDVVDHYLATIAKRSASKLDDMLVPLVGKSIRLTILVLVVLQIAQALSDKPLTAILTSLGVGGLAVALAGQDTIKNFFGSLVILADKPFEIGDKVRIDGFEGHVEHVGFRSTRIRSMDGHLVTVSNAEMVNKTVDNLGKRPYIRRLSNLGITYDTPPEKVERAVQIIKDILQENKAGLVPGREPRVCFEEFKDFSLNIRVEYWTCPPDEEVARQFNHRVNIEILKRFNQEGIDFAFPSQTIYVAGDSKRQFSVKMVDKHA